MLIAPSRRAKADRAVRLKTMDGCIEKTERKGVNGNNRVKSESIRTA
jgi:hypothetical protein